MNIPPILAGEFLVVGAGIALMYSVQLPVRVAGALLGSGAITMAYGWSGFCGFWMLLGIFIFFASDAWRPLIRPARQGG